MNGKNTSQKTESEKWAVQPTSTEDGGDKDTLRLGGDGVRMQQTANVDCGEKNADLFTML